MTEKKKSEEFWLTPKDHHTCTHHWRRLSLAERRRRELMTDFFGEGASMEILARIEPGVACGDVIGAVYAKLKADLQTPLQYLREHWSQYVGENLSYICFPKELKNGELCIAVKNSSLFFILQNEYKDEILDKLKSFEKQRIQSVRFVISGTLDKKAGKHFKY